MKITEIEAKTLLASVKQPDDWFGLKYNMNLYRGCLHQCIYCDSRSECYQIEHFDDEVLVKVNAIDLLRRELPRKRVKGTIGTGSMNDPYMPLEEKYRLTRRALEVIADHHFPVHAITKSTLVLRDVDILSAISRVYAAVTVTITCADDALGKKVEPGAPPVSERFAAIGKLVQNGILAGITMMPILPFIEDSAENITRIVKMAHEQGAKYIMPAFGMTIRDRQRMYYYNKLDLLFPGLSKKYNQRFGGQYFAPANDKNRLERVFFEQCERHGIATQMPKFTVECATQPVLF